MSRSLLFLIFLSSTSANADGTYSALHGCYAAIYKMQYAVYSYSDGAIQKHGPSGSSLNPSAQDVSAKIQAVPPESHLALLFRETHQQLEGYFIATPKNLSFYPQNKIDKTCTAKNGMIQIQIQSAPQATIGTPYYFGFSPPAAKSSSTGLKEVVDSTGIEHIPSIQQWYDRRGQSEKDFCTLVPQPVLSKDTLKKFSNVLAEKIKMSVAKDIQSSRLGSESETQELAPKMETISDSENPEISALRDVASTLLACRQAKEFVVLQEAVDLLEKYHATKNKKILDQKRRESAKETSI